MVGYDSSWLDSRYLACTLGLLTLWSRIVGQGERAWYRARITGSGRAPAFSRFVMIRPIQAMWWRSREDYFCAGQGAAGSSTMIQTLSYDENAGTLGPSDP